MKKACFITGTDTGVGKTAVAASLADGFHKIGISVGVMKPVETGCRLSGGGNGPVGADATLLKTAAASTSPLDIINPYSFIPPISPELAARQAGVEIDFDVIRDAYEEIRLRSDVIIVEGAGGLFTPLGKSTAGKDGATMADLAGFLDIPLVIVAPSRIGVINQCLLTVRAARSKGLPLMGIVLNHPAPPDPGDHSLDSNMKEVAGHTGEEVLGEIPYAKKNTPYVDVRGIIKRFLGAV